MGLHDVVELDSVTVGVSLTDDGPVQIVVHVDQLNPGHVVCNLSCKSCLSGPAIAGDANNATFREQFHDLRKQQIGVIESHGITIAEIVATSSSSKGRSMNEGLSTD